MYSIGRRGELEQLAAHRRSAAEGRGGIVLIGGDAGIGKSELLRRFAAHIASGRTMLASARCVEFVQTPLAPLRDLLGSSRGGATPLPTRRRAHSSSG